MKNGHTIKELYDLLMCRKKISMYFSSFGYLLFTCFDLGQAGGFPEPEIIHFNPKEFDFGKKKAFPFRDQVHVDIYNA